MVDLYNWVDAEAMANLEARIAVDTFASGKMNDARLKVQVGAPLRVGHRGRSASPQPAACDRTLPACCATSTAAHCLLPLPERVVRCCAHRPIALCGPMGHLTSIGSPSVVGCAVAWHTAALECTPLNRIASLCLLRMGRRCLCVPHSLARARARDGARTHARTLT